jgi:predicted transcriptional regulator
MASDAGIMGIMAAAVKQYYTHAEAIDRGGDYVPMLGDIVAELNGMNMAEEVKKGEG